MYKYKEDLTKADLYLEGLKDWNLENGEKGYVLRASVDIDFKIRFGFHKPTIKTGTVSVILSEKGVEGLHVEIDYFSNEKVKQLVQNSPVFHEYVENARSIAQDMQEKNAKIKIEEIVQRYGDIGLIFSLNQKRMYRIVLNGQTNKVLVAKDHTHAERKWERQIECTNLISDTIKEKLLQAI